MYMPMFFTADIEKSHLLYKTRKSWSSCFPCYIYADILWASHWPVINLTKNVLRLVFSSPRDKKILWDITVWLLA